jgi:hypothetical protein
MYTETEPAEESCPRRLGRELRLPKERVGQRFEKGRRLFPIRGKRTLSTAARRKIAAAQRARWVRVKAGKFPCFCAADNQSLVTASRYSRKVQRITRVG